MFLDEKLRWAGFWMLDALKGKDGTIITEA